MFARRCQRKRPLDEPQSGHGTTPRKAEEKERAEMSIEQLPIEYHEEGPIQDDVCDRDLAYFARLADRVQNVTLAWHYQVNDHQPGGRWPGGADGKLDPLHPPELGTANPRMIFAIEDLERLLKELHWGHVI